MALFFLTVFTMIAFAANSILTRFAVEGLYIDALSFAVLRVLAGAAVLAGLVLIKGGTLRFSGRDRLIGAGSLAVYMIGFSLAYISLDAGLGALILFGVVQISMFFFATVTGNRPTSGQIVGASIAFVGLAIALWPETSAPSSIFGAVCMVLAGVGWAAYTISGRAAREPLATTAANFCICLPVLTVVLIPWLETATLPGVGVAIVCGAVTSGLGYALWYRVLPHIQQGVAAVVQLSVPVIAIIGGTVLLGESLTLKVVFAAALVVLGIGFAVTSRSSRADHK